jgi:hypothetical protein
MKAVDWLIACMGSMQMLWGSYDHAWAPCRGHAGPGTYLMTLDTDVLLSHEIVMDPIPATVLEIARQESV